MRFHFLLAIFLFVKINAGAQSIIPIPTETMKNYTFATWNCLQNITFGAWNNPSNWDPKIVPNGMAVIAKTDCAPLISTNTTIHKILNNGKLFIENCTLSMYHMIQENELHIVNATYLGFLFQQSPNTLVNIIDSYAQSYGMQLWPDTLLNMTGKSFMYDPALSNYGGTFRINPNTNAYIELYHQWSGTLELIQPNAKFLFCGDVMLMGGTLRIDLTRLKIWPSFLTIMDCWTGGCSNIAMNDIRLEIVPSWPNASYQIINNYTLIVELL